MSKRYNMAKTVVETKTFLKAPAFEGQMLDLFTASAIVQVFEALSPSSQKRFDEIPLPRLIDFAMSKVG